VQCANFSQGCESSKYREKRFGYPHPYPVAVWISISVCKLTILPDIQPANRRVIISSTLYPGPVDTEALEFERTHVTFFCRPNQAQNYECKPVASITINIFVNLSRVAVLSISWILYKKAMQVLTRAPGPKGRNVTRESSIRGLYHCAGGWYWKLDKNSYFILYLNLGSLVLCFVGLKLNPPTPPVTAGLSQMLFLLKCRT